jgi:tryptophan-rich sensory protein
MSTPIVDYGSDIVVSIFIFLTVLVASGLSIRRLPTGKVDYGFSKPVPGVPPGIVFAIVWPILYGIFTTDFYITFRVKDYANIGWQLYICLRAVHLFLNAVWTPLAFTQFRWKTAGAVLAGCIITSAGIIAVGAVYAAQNTDQPILIVPPCLMGLPFIWYCVAMYWNVKAIQMHTDKASSGKYTRDAL